MPVTLAFPPTLRSSVAEAWLVTWQLFEKEWRGGDSSRAEWKTLRKRLGCGSLAGWRGVAWRLPPWVGREEEEESGGEKRMVGWHDGGLQHGGWLTSPSLEEQAN